MQYAGLAIKSVVMHQIVRKSSASDASPVLSDVAAPLDDANRAFIQEQIRKTLGSYARPIVEDEGTSPVPEVVRGYLANPETDPLVLSQELAKRLQDVQHTMSPGGIFVVAEASLDGMRAMLIAKLEHEQGVRASPTQLADGHTTFGIELLKDLLFTTGSKVFKVALFVAEKSSQNALSGVVVDRQMAGSSVAHFFLSTFLGCKFAERADLLTQRFHDGAQSWINGIKDPEKRGRYEVALLSELQSNHAVLSVNRFAQGHLDVEDRDDFVHGMQGTAVPLRDFDKDVALIKSKISRLKLETEAGITVLAPPESVEDGTVLIEANADETTTVTVRDRVTKMSGHSAQSKTSRR
jgi:hypothetical protein